MQLVFNSRQYGRRKTLVKPPKRPILTPRVNPKLPKPNVPEYDIGSFTSSSAFTNTQMSKDTTFIITFRSDGAERERNLKHVVKLARSTMGPDLEIRVVNEDRVPMAPSLRYELIHTHNAIVTEVYSNSFFDRYWGFNIALKATDRSYAILGDADIPLRDNIPKLLRMLKHKQAEFISPYCNVCHLSEKTSQLLVSDPSRLPHIVDSIEKYDYWTFSGGIVMGRVASFADLGLLFEVEGWGFEDRILDAMIEISKKPIFIDDRTTYIHMWHKPTPTKKMEVSVSKKLQALKLIGCRGRHKMHAPARIYCKNCTHVGSDKFMQLHASQLKGNVMKYGAFSDMNADVVAVVPIKHHSSRVPGKNYRMCGDKPLFWYVLETLRQVPQIKMIIVDTDSEIIKNGVAYFFGQSIHIYSRPQHLCGDDVSTNRLLLNIMDAFRLQPSQLLVQTHCTNPFLRAETIIMAIHELMASRAADSVFSASCMHTRLYDHDINDMNHNRNVLIPTQNLDPIYQENSCVYAFYGSTLLDHKARIGPNARVLEMSDDESIDIDWMSDFARAENMMMARVDRPPVWWNVVDGHEIVTGEPAGRSPVANTDIFVLAGGLRPDNTVHPWVAARLDMAANLWHQTAGARIFCLGGGTYHKPAPINQAGFVIHESTACAKYLVQKQVDGRRIFREWASYDTVANGLFAFLNFVIPLGMQHITVITSKFHMERTRLIFNHINRISKAGVAITFVLTDDCMTEDMLATRQTRERESIELFHRTVESKIHTMPEFIDWFYVEHGCYNHSPPDVASTIDSKATY